MKTKLIIAGIGNLIDIFATFILTQYYNIPELNPFMAWLLQWPIFAMNLKFFIVSGILVFVWYSEHNKYTNFLANFAAILYGGVGAYYLIYFLSFILF